VAQFGAARAGAFVIVLSPGEVQADRLGLFPGGGRREQPVQFGLAFDGVALFAKHDVEAVTEGVPATGTGVVRGQRGAVQSAGPFGLLSGGSLPVLRDDVLEERLHDVPGRHLPAFQARPHPLGVALPEDSAPAATAVESVHQPVQVPGELQHLSRELFYSHHPTPRPT
jgi:hypothetical protein